MSQAVKKTPAAKKPAEHPKYIDMVVAAIAALKERTGSSRQAILKYIQANYKVKDNANVHLRLALKKGVASGALLQPKGTGASGSFKLAAAAKKVAKKPAAKKPTAKKPAAKKATPKKKAAAKKSTPKKTKKVTKTKSSAKKASAKKVKKPVKVKKAATKKPAAKKAKVVKKTPKKKASAKK